MKRAEKDLGKIKKRKGKGQNRKSSGRRVVGLTPQYRTGPGLDCIGTEGGGSTGGWARGKSREVEPNSAHDTTRRNFPHKKVAQWAVSRWFHTPKLPAGSAPTKHTVGAWRAHRTRGTHLGDDKEKVIFSLRID